MYIPSHQTLGNHPKLRRLARTLAISRPAAVGHLHYLWWWSQDYAPDGDLSYERYTAEDIADAAMWEGDAYAFVDALKSSGFVDDRDGLLFLHDWEHYGGKVVTDAAKDRERKRAKRNPATSDDAPGSSAHVPDTSTGSPPEVHRKSGVDKIRLEETRQEETREPPKSPAASAAAVPNGPYRLFARFCEENDTDESQVNASEKGKQMRIAKTLLTEHSEDEVSACAAYLRSQSWRTGLIDLGSVSAEIGRWKMGGSPSQERPRGSPPTRGDRKVGAVLDTGREFDRLIGASDGDDKRPLQAGNVPAGPGVRAGTERPAVARLLGPPANHRP